MNYAKNCPCASSRRLTARLAGGLIPVLLLLAGGMLPHNALGQNQGVSAVPLGDSFVFFVDRINSDLLKVGNTADNLSGVEVINDPQDSNNRVIRFTNSFDHAYTRFFFADAADQGAPRDMTTNRAAENVLHFRMLVDPSNPKDGTSSEIVTRYRLSVQFEDYGPEDGNTAAHNNPFRLRWAIPDNMRNGEWHDVTLTLPPATWADLEAAKTANTITTLEKNWLYAGSWAGFEIGLDLLGPSTTQAPELWTEFEWDNVESVGIHWDWPGSGGQGAPILLDDVYIGPANLDLTGLLPPADPPTAVTGVNFSVDGNHHVISWTHNTAADDIAQYKVYASTNPITDVKAQGVSLVQTITDPAANGGNHTVRHPGELPHPSLGSSIYYAVTSLASDRLENTNVSNSSAGLAASYSPAVVQLTDSQAATLKANITAENVVSSGFPSGTMPFMLDDSHRQLTEFALPDNNDDLSGSFWIGYSDANEFYIYAEVTDDELDFIPATNNPLEAWQYDNIEFGWGNYDVRNAGGSIVGGTPHPDRKRGDHPDYQFRLSAHGTETDATARTYVHNGGDKIDPGSAAYASMTGGYKILAVFPVDGIQNAEDAAPALPGPDEIRFFPMTITMGDRESGDRRHIITWSLKPGVNNNWFQTPSQWQTVAMVGRNVPDTPQAEPEGIPPVHTRILHVDGGPVTVDLDAAFGKSVDAAWTVHHYVIDGGPTVNTPGASFVVPSRGWAQLDAGMLTFTPTGPGGVKIAVQPGTDAPQPLKVEVMSADAPMVQGVSSGANYNAQANGYAETVTLTVGKETSKELELFDRFTDPDDIILSYNYSNDNIDLRPLAHQSGCRDGNVVRFHSSPSPLRIRREAAMHRIYGFMQWIATTNTPDCALA